MFVQEDFKHLRLTTNNKLQLFATDILNIPESRRTAQKSKLGYLQYLKVVLREYAAYLSMHGMNRIFANTNAFKRITWLVGFLLCLMVLMYVSCHVAWNYHTNPLVTVIAVTHYPVFRIPFPEITICNQNRFNWQRFEMAQRVFLKPQHLLIPKYREIFLHVVNMFDTLSFGKFNKFKNLTAIPPMMLQELSYINFQSVAEFMAWKCHEILSHCRWADDEYSCCDIFFMRNSQLGSCLAFNTIASIDGLDKQRFDPFWPWHTKEPGIFYGLKVRIHLREHDHSPMQTNKKGILVMLVEPSVWFSNPVQIDTHTRTSISVDAVLYNYSEDTRVVSSKVRTCLFQDELENQFYKSLPNYPYMFENCRSQCQLEYLVKFCNCTLFYPQDVHRPCRLADFPCLFYHNEKIQNFEQIGESEHIYRYFSDAMKCTCLYNCKSLDYRTTITTAFMNNREVNFNNSFIDLSVFFQKEFITLFMTTVRYTVTDLMASFGGLAGLCIGCSLLSLVEIAYFFIIEVPHRTLLYFKQSQHLRWRRKGREVQGQFIEKLLKN